MKELCIKYYKTPVYFDLLSPQERKIVEMRHGLADGIKYTLEEVAREFGVTRERIRQIEAKAHEKLRCEDRDNNQLTNQMKYHKLKDKKTMIIQMEGQLKEEIVNAVAVEHSKGNYTTLASWVRLACLEKLGIITRNDLLPIKQINEQSN